MSGKEVVWWQQALSGTACGWLGFLYLNLRCKRTLGFRFVLWREVVVTTGNSQ